MSRTESFRRQHKEILEIAGEISSQLNSNQLAKDASGVRKSLTTLAGKLNIHLAMEDKSLYPKLINHQDANVSTVAKKYIEEMGSLADVFGQYLKKWSLAATIQNNPVDFINETKGIFNALSKRIDKEDNELYCMFDKLD
jgi:iron-sulfur cluster repair protein YtfE (RIC family)